MFIASAFELDSEAGSVKADHAVILQNEPDERASLFYRLFQACLVTLKVAELKVVEHFDSQYLFQRRTQQNFKFLLVGDINRNE